MSETSSRKKSKRSKKKKPTKDSFDFDGSDMEISTEPNNAPESSENVEETNAAAFSEMTEEEMEQHLKLCMKLAVENKINMKNAFGLHLIEIMQKIVKKSGVTDIQQASLSLQASSKIYAGRVEALYQETCKFHGQLQSIAAEGLKDKKSKNAEEDVDDMMDVDDEDGDEVAERAKSKPQKNKCKNFLKPEETITIETEITSTNTRQPHENFVAISSAFSTSREAPKLVNCMQLLNDSCALKCAAPLPCFRPHHPNVNSPYLVPPKLKGFLEQIKNVSVDNNLDFKAFPETPFTNQMSTPKTPGVSKFFSDDDNCGSPLNDTVFGSPQFLPPPPPPPALQVDDADAQNAIEPFDVLNITVDILISDIHAAVTNNGIDRNLLPPNSALKKMLDKSNRKSSIKPPIERSTKKKTKEPFLAGKSADNIKQFFVKGRTLCVSQKTLKEWNIESTSNIDLGYDFIQELENMSEKDDDFDFKRRMELDKVLEIIKQNDLQYQFKHYFNKQSQMWKILRRKLCLNRSSMDMSYHDQTERRAGSLAPEALAVSFQNLSIHDSLQNTPPPPPPPPEDRPSDVPLAPLPCPEGDESSIMDAPVFDESEHQFLAEAEPFETDIEEMLVKPPELVRPATMKFEAQPSNLNTEKIKDLLWRIISKRLEQNAAASLGGAQPILFSEVYIELKDTLERKIAEFISIQFAFVMLLMLSNEKTLLIEQAKELGDLSIKQDIPEIDVSKNL